MRLGGNFYGNYFIVVNILMLILLTLDVLLRGGVWYVWLGGSIILNILGGMGLYIHRMREKAASRYYRDRLDSLSNEIMNLGELYDDKELK